MSVTLTFPDSFTFNLRPKLTIDFERILNLARSENSNDQQEAVENWIAASQDYRIPVTQVVEYGQQLFDLLIQKNVAEAFYLLFYLIQNREVTALQSLQNFLSACQKACGDPLFTLNEDCHISDIVAEILIKPCNSLLEGTQTNELIECLIKLNQFESVQALLESVAGDKPSLFPLKAIMMHSSLQTYFQKEQPPTFSDLWKSAFSLIDHDPAMKKKTISALLEITKKEEAPKEELQDLWFHLLKNSFLFSFFLEHPEHYDVLIRLFEDHEHEEKFHLLFFQTCLNELSQPNTNHKKKRKKQLHQDTVHHKQLVEVHEKIYARFPSFYSSVTLPLIRGLLKNKATLRLAWTVLERTATANCRSSTNHDLQPVIKDFTVQFNACEFKEKKEIKAKIQCFLSKNLLSVDTANCFEFAIDPLNAFLNRAHAIPSPLSHQSLLELYALFCKYQDTWNSSPQKMVPLDCLVELIFKEFAETHNANLLQTWLIKILNLLIKKGKTSSAASPENNPSLYSHFIQKIFSSYTKDAEHNMALHSALLSILKFIACHPPLANESVNQIHEYFTSFPPSDFNLPEIVLNNMKIAFSILNKELDFRQKYPATWLKIYLIIHQKVPAETQPNVLYDAFCSLISDLGNDSTQNFYSFFRSVKLLKDHADMISSEQMQDCFYNLAQFFKTHVSKCFTNKQLDAKSIDLLMLTFFSLINSLDEFLKSEAGHAITALVLYNELISLFNEMEKFKLFESRPRNFFIAAQKIMTIMRSNVKRSSLFLSSSVLTMFLNHSLHESKEHLIAYRKWVHSTILAIPKLPLHKSEIKKIVRYLHNQTDLLKQIFGEAPEMLAEAMEVVKKLNEENEFEESVLERLKIFKKVVCDPKEIEEFGKLIHEIADCEDPEMQEQARNLLLFEILSSQNVKQSNLFYGTLWMNLVTCSLMQRNFQFIDYFTNPVAFNAQRSLFRDPELRTQSRIFYVSLYLQLIETYSTDRKAQIPEYALKCAKLCCEFLSELDLLNITNSPISIPLEVKKTTSKLFNSVLSNLFMGKELSEEDKRLLFALFTTAKFLNLPELETWVEEYQKYFPDFVNAEFEDLSKRIFPVTNEMEVLEAKAFAKKCTFFFDYSSQISLDHLFLCVRCFLIHLAILKDPLSYKEFMTWLHQFAHKKLIENTENITIAKCPQFFKYLVKELIITATSYPGFQDLILEFLVPYLKIFIQEPQLQLANKIKILDSFYYTLVHAPSANLINSYEMLFNHAYEHNLYAKNPVKYWEHYFLGKALSLNLHPFLQDDAAAMKLALDNIKEKLFQMDTAFTLKRAHDIFLTFGRNVYSKEDQEKISREIHTRFQHLLNGLIKNNTRDNNT